MGNATFKDWLDDASEGEPIEGIVLGKRPYNSDWPLYPIGKLMSYSEALQYLEIEFNDGFGSQGNPPMHAWTKNWIIATDEYDGATSWFKIPRNPIDCNPCEPGGG